MPRWRRLEPFSPARTAPRRPEFPESGQRHYRCCCTNVRAALAIVLALALAVAAPSAQRAPPLEPILILVSFDGWRWDYIDCAPVPNLPALPARVACAKAFLPRCQPPTFPSP